MKIVDLCGGVDITIDTNVLAHCSNPGSPFCESSLMVLEFMKTDAKVVWVLDDQGKKAPDPQTSVLFAEYKKVLVFGSPARALFEKYLAGSRVSFSRRPNESERRIIRSLIPKNSYDRAVVGAALGSKSKVLVTNDLSDIPEEVRDALYEKFSVEALQSHEAAGCEVS